MASVSIGPYQQTYEMWESFDTLHKTDYPLKLYFQNHCFPCFFPVRQQILPMPIYVICDFHMHKTDLPDSNIFGRFPWQISKYVLPLESGNLQLEQTKFPVFFLCFCKILNSLCFP